MAVKKKKVVVKKRSGAKRRRSRKGAADLGDLSSLSLPTESKGVDPDLSRYIVLYYGREGVGKTSAGASHPDSMFFAFEPGTKALDVFDFFEQNNIPPSWDGFRIGVDLLVKQSVKKRQFKTIVIDTADRAYDMCMDYICRTHGIEHVSQDSTGKSDRSGRGWTALKREFTDQLYRLNQAGYGLVLTSHSKVHRIEASGGKTFDLIVPSLTGQAFGIIRGITDFILYLEYVQDSSGKQRRVIITTGDDLITAKHRGAMPHFLPLPDPTKSGPTAYDVVLAAFQGEHQGLDAATLRPSRSASKASRASLAQARLKAKRHPAKAKKVARNPKREGRARISKRKR